mmetsp:Transcript_115344/g.246512  ORF Transcript_115344/g.246512 Transcript_115344/m.246512 type:complete len:332 (-) Transcript_115344:28-1023(-)
MFDGHDASFLEKLVRVVIDQLSVDKDVAVVLANLFHLCFHLVPLCLLNLLHGFKRVDLHASSIDLNLVRIHLAICDHHLAILQHLLVANTNPLLEDEALLQERILQRSAGLLDHLDVVQVRLPLQPQHRVHCERGEVLLLVLKKLRAERRPRDLQKVLAECGQVLAVVHGHGIKLLPGGGQSYAVALDDNLGVHLLLYQVLRVPQHLGSKDNDRGGAVSAFIVLRLGDVDQDLCGRVIDPDRFQDRGPIVSHGGVTLTASFTSRHGLHDLVHALGAKGRLHEVADSDGADEGLKPRILAALLSATILEDVGAARQKLMHDWGGGERELRAK